MTLSGTIGLICGWVLVALGFLFFGIATWLSVIEWLDEKRRKPAVGG